VWHIPLVFGVPPPLPVPLAPTLPKGAPLAGRCIGPRGTRGLRHLLLVSTRLLPGGQSPPWSPPSSCYRHPPLVSSRSRAPACYGKSSVEAGRVKNFRESVGQRDSAGTHVGRLGPNRACRNAAPRVPASRNGSAELPRPDWSARRDPGSPAGRRPSRTLLWIPCRDLGPGNPPSAVARVLHHV